MAAPAMTFNAEANVLASQALAASGTVTADVDASTVFEVQLQFKNAGGASVSATNGLRVEVFRRLGTTPTNDTEAMTSFDLPTTASTSRYKSLALPTGKYRIKLTNLDTAQGITVEITSAVVASVS